MKMNYFYISILLLEVIFGAINCLSLNEHIGHYEPLEYSRDLLRERHSRTRRSAYDKIIKLNITAFNKVFPLRLHPDTDTFHPQAVVEINGAEEPLDTSHLYEGVVEGYKGSKVVGAITDGIFQGRIALPSGDSYHVERKEHYRENKDLSNNKNAHSVIYHDDSLNIDGFYRRIRERRAASGKATAEFCANGNNDVFDWMERVKRSAVPEQTSEAFSHMRGDNPYLRSKRENPFSYSRERRAADGRTTCNLFLQGDPELWRYFDEELFESQASELQIREEISALFHQHVNAVNEIYKGTVFRVSGDSRDSFANHGFRVDRVLINKTCDCSTGECLINQFCSRNIDASNLLNLNSRKNHNDFCLAYLFTYRDFDGGTLGLAWVAEAGKVGGVCSKNGAVRDGNVQGMRSLNTGIITFNNYRKRVPPRVSYLTFAHELGHNFGAKHDGENLSPSCTPYTDSGSSSGNFIMFASATTGTKPNNRFFSRCSQTTIARVLNSVVNELNSKRNCFKEATGTWCGNQIREEPEEQCDCGYQNDCPPNDPNCCKCCNGQSDDNKGANACRLKSGKDCDPSQGPCCNAGCGFKTGASLCKPEDSCTERSFCTISSAQCPEPQHKDDDTYCNGNTQICKSGMCSNSVCELVKTGNRKWTDCEPEPVENDPTALCFVSCTPDNRTCYSSAQSDQPDFPSDFKRLLDDLNSTKISMPAGHICSKEKGFCDHFQKCRLINGKGPLARLKDLIFSESTLQLIKEWVTVHWWAVALSIVGFIVLMVLFVKCCAVHTPSSNPKKAPARRISQTLTLRRRQQGHPPGGPRDPQQRDVPLLPDQNIAHPQRSRDQPPAYTDVFVEEPRARASGPPPGARGDRSQPVQSRQQRQQQYELQQRHLNRGNQ